MIYVFLSKIHTLTSWTRCGPGVPFFSQIDSTSKVIFHISQISFHSVDSLPFDPLYSSHTVTLPFHNIFHHITSSVNILKNARDIYSLTPLPPPPLLFPSTLIHSLHYCSFQSCTYFHSAFTTLSTSVFSHQFLFVKHTYFTRFPT